MMSRSISRRNLPKQAAGIKRKDGEGFRLSAFCSEVDVAAKRNP
jgi:hypothetical protein